MAASINAIPKIRMEEEVNRSLSEYQSDRCGEKTPATFNPDLLQLIHDYTGGDVAADFTGLQLMHFNRINSESLALEKASNQPNGMDACKKGIWYASKYFEALKKHSGAKERFDTFVKQGTFYHGLAPKSAFKMISNSTLPTGKEMYKFLLKEGIRPSVAVRLLREGLSLLECATTPQLSMYLALLDRLGEERFDMLFANDSPTPLRIDGSLEPLNRLLERVAIDSEEDIVRGDLAFFSNVQPYVARHPLGEGRGWNALCYDDTKPKRVYVGYGLPAAGVVKEQVEEVLFESLIETPIRPEEFINEKAVTFIYTKYLAGNLNKSKQLVAAHGQKKYTREEFDKMPAKVAFQGERTAGKLRLWVNRLRLDRIELLANTPIDKIQSVFASFSTS